MSGTSQTPSVRGGANGEHRTVDLLRQIETGETDPKCIATADRRQLVAYLMGDGYSTAEIAQIFKVGDRTIERDKRPSASHTRSCGIRNSWNGWPVGW